MTASAQLRLSLGEYSQAAYQAIAPEVKVPVSKRAKAEVNLEGSVLVINIEAHDLGALRAVVGAYLRWVMATVDSVKALGLVS